MELFLVLLFVTFLPSVCIVLLACLLSLFRVQPPKPRRDGWFGESN